MKNITLIISILSFTINCYSQQTATGCLLPDNRVYTDKGNLGLYNNSPSQGLDADYCEWSQNTGANCFVCNGYLNHGGVCLSGGSFGIENTFSMVACPIDDYAPLLCIIITALVFKRL